MVPPRCLIQHDDDDDAIEGSIPSSSSQLVVLLVRLGSSGDDRSRSSHSQALADHKEYIGIIDEV
jgi:hypothetical protein